MTRFFVSPSCTHAEDIASGAVFAPGETAKGVDPKHPFDKAKIDDGILVEIKAPKRSAKSNQEESK